ncbi:hypothetical protein FBU31_001519, partial [Coemansia sp. 'formosensis']
LRARVRRQKRRSSIASLGNANVRVVDQQPGKKLEDDDDDCGPLWMIDGLAESPGAEKAKRRARGPPVPSKPVARDPGSVAPRPLFTAAAKTAAAGVATKPAGVATKPAGKEAAAVPKRVKLGSSAAAMGRKFSGITEGSVHDRRVSFGSSVLNPFVVGGDDFDSDLQQKLDRKALVSAVRTQRLEAKSSAAARLNRILAVPPTPGDDRNDKDFVLRSSSDTEDDDSDAGRKPVGRRRGGGSDAGGAGRRMPGSLGVRGLVEQRRHLAALTVEKENVQGTRPIVKSQKQSRASAGLVAPSSSPPEARVSLEQFNEICQASALQMINSADVKKIMKLQGIGKRRAEQIQACVQEQGPIVHVCDLQTRLQFKNKLILAILSTFA